MHSDARSLGLPLPKEDVSSHNLAGLCLDSATVRSEQAQVGPQKSLLDLIAEDTSCESFLSHQIEKNAGPTSLAKIDQNVVKEQKPVEVKPKSVPLEPLSLAKIIQQEKGASNSQPATVSSACRMPGELHFNPLRKSQVESSPKQLSLSDLTKLSINPAFSLRVADVGERSATLSDLSSHYKTVSKHPNLSHVVGVHLLESHTTTSVEGSGSAPSAITAFKSGIAFQCGHRRVALSMKGKSNLALMLSHLTEDSVPHPLSRLRQRVDKKLMENYTKYFFKMFDFSSQSPDDIVQEKQRNVFPK